VSDRPLFSPNIWPLIYSGRLLQKLFQLGAIPLGKTLITTNSSVSKSYPSYGNPPSGNPKEKKWS